MSVKPKYSLITASYNSIESIGKLAGSIKNQKNASFEWIVIDGCSTDGTVEYLKRAGLDFLTLVSERDRGIYDALNKGIQRSQGEYLLFLGADDQLASDDTLNTINGKIESNDVKAKVYFGDVIVKTDKEKIFYSTIGFKTLMINSVHHQGALYRRDLFEAFNYDISFPVVADYELNLKIYLNNIKFTNLDMIISICGGYGLSNTISEKLCYQDMHKIRGKYMNHYISIFFYLIGTLNIHRKKFLLAS